MADSPAPQRNAQPDFRTLPQHTGPITALQFIARILDKTGAPNRDKTIDHVAAGDPTTAITGIATMALASLDGLKRAAAAGRNLILSYDPPFWSGNDDLDRIEGNSLFLEKRDFIRAHNLVCFNLHDHWRDRAPDGVAVGMAKGLGWTQYQADAGNPAMLHLPPTNLESLARDLQSQLDDPTIRVVGDPKLEVRSVGAMWGTADQMPAIKLLNSAVDVCGQFLPPNTKVVSTQGRVASQQHDYATSAVSKSRPSFPMVLLIIACAAVFGPALGLVYSSTGLLASAALNYAIGMWLGRGVLLNWLGPRFDAMRSALMRRGLITTAVVRTIPGSPFALVSVAAGASDIRFLDYLIGTAIGITVPVGLLTVATEQTSRLLTEPSAIQLALLVAVIALWIAVAFGAQALLERIAKGQGRGAR